MKGFLDMARSKDEILKGLFDNTLSGKAPPVVELTKEGL
jgi:hypothetical protein